MTEDIDWHERWDTGRIGFHRGEVHPDLITYAPRFLGDDGPRTVLVPLCGKSLDLPWLVREGHQVIGVELVPRAVEELHAEHGIDATRERVGRFTAWRSPGLTVLCGDLFDLTPEQVAGVDRIWDRAALVALPPDRRPTYVAHLRATVPPGWLLLQNAFEYDQSLMDGPPWSVPDAEIRRHYGDCEIELLHQRDAIDEVRWKDRGHRYWLSTTYLIQAPAG